MIFHYAQEQCGKKGVYVGYKTAEKKPETDVVLDDLETVQSSAVMLEKRAELWASEREMDWESIYQNERHFKVPLPTYPFSKERYWIGEQFEEEPSIGDRQGRDGVNLQEDEKPGQPEISIFQAQLCQALPSERLAMIEKYLQDVLASLLAFHPPDVPELHQGFFDMGMESVLVERLRISLEECFQIDLADTAIFDYPNI